MILLKTLKTHSEPVNSILLLNNGNFASASSDKIVIYSKNDFNPILRITEFKIYISHITELHSENTILFCHNGFSIIQLSDDNKKYQLKKQYTERYGMNKAIEYKYTSKSNKKYNLYISAVYGVHIFEIDENFEKVNLIKTINQEELVFNIFQLDKDIFIYTSNSMLSNGNNCIRFWNFEPLQNIKTINNLYCSPGIYNLSKFQENLILLGLEKNKNSRKYVNDGYNINGIAIIDTIIYEIIQIIETHECVRSLLLTQNNNIIIGSSFKIVEYKKNEEEGLLEQICEKELFNYINNVIIEISKGIFAIGSNDKKIILLKKDN